MRRALSSAEASERYGRLLDAVYGGQLQEEEHPEITPSRLQEYWLRGRLGSRGETRDHGAVRIIDYGEWNRSGRGPCFRHTVIELGGKQLCGDMVLDLSFRAWEQEHRSEDEAYDEVVLHVLLNEPPKTWYTRTAEDREVPILVLPSERATEVFGQSIRGGQQLLSDTPPLADMPTESIRALLQSAAAHRAGIKRRLFRERTADVGAEQAWYEAWAETLGYGGNSLAMLMLARRVPLRELTPGLHHAEAMLMGAAGFLLPVMPEQATDDERAYHHELWNDWWANRERLSGDYPLPWARGPVRPLNHPHRRVAALAEARWLISAAALHADTYEEIVSRFTVKGEGFWSTHYSLYAPAMKHACALVGRGTAKAFLVNFVLPLDERPQAWGVYLSVKAESVPESVRETAERLFGERPDLDFEGRRQSSLLRHHYAQQGLLQLQADFGLGGHFPAALADAR